MDHDVYWIHLIESSDREFWRDEFICLLGKYHCLLIGNFGETDSFVYWGSTAVHLDNFSHTVSVVSNEDML